MLDTEYDDANVFWFEDDKLLLKDPVFKDTSNYPAVTISCLTFGGKAPGSPSFHPCLWSANMAKKYLSYTAW